MDNKYYAEIEARVKAATLGPWKYKDNGFDGGVYSADGNMVVGGEPCEGRIESDDLNADFIAHAREDIPNLLADNRALQAELERLRKENEIIKNDIKRYRDVHTCAKRKTCKMAKTDHLACYNCPEWEYRGLCADNGGKE